MKFSPVYVSVLQNVTDAILISGPIMHCGLMTKMLMAKYAEACSSATIKKALLFLCHLFAYIYELKFWTKLLFVTSFSLCQMVK